MPLYRVTRNDDRSERFVEELDAISVADGRWVFLRDGAPLAALGSAEHGTSDYTVEIEQHGGIWEKLEPELLPLTR